MKSKLGLGPVVALALLLAVGVVSVVSFQNFYQYYQSDLLNKVEGTSTFVVTIDSIQSTPIQSTLFIQNKNLDYGIIQEIKVNNQQCNLIGSDVIVENSLSQIALDCLFLKGTTANIVVVTDLGLFEAQHIVR